MIDLTQDSLRQLAQQAGFQGSDINTAAAIAEAESSGNPAAVGDLNLTPGGSVGLWQINLVAHPQYTAAQLMNPLTNAQAAYAIYKAAGYSFTPWSTYKNGAYAQYLPPGSGGSSSAYSMMPVSFNPISNPQTSLGPNGYVYGYTGPPFNFLGHFSKTQQNAFNAWVRARENNFPALQQHFQIRAAVLRKTAGVLEQFYSTLNDEALAPTFKKEPWKPGSQGAFNYPYRDDQLPMVATYQIKDYMKEQFQRQDEGVFAMNYLRNIIEKAEDKAEKAYQAMNPTQFTDKDNTVESLITRINGYFSQPEYEAVLVNDQTDVYPAGTTQPRFRVHQLDIPTQWEIEQMTSAPAGTGGSVDLKEISS
jgi:hypothetical protein